ncbi:DUF1016 N-terminal domain-containing protein, partial [uncultured Duncaniella sp.]
MKSELKKYDNLNADDAQFISDIKAIVYTAKQKAYQAADLFQVAANWLVGKRIIEQEQHGRERAEYGKRIIELASEALTAEYGKGYSATTLRNFRKFYLAFRGLQIQQAVVAEFKSCFLNQQPLLAESPTTISGKECVYPMPNNLSWMHYERLMRVKNEDERDWYLREASTE